MYASFRIASLLLAASCASPAAARRPAVNPHPALALRDADFPAAAALLAGIAQPDDDPALRIGDAALLALEFSRGEQIERQLLLLEVIELPRVQAAFRDHDPSATFRRSTTASLTTTPKNGKPTTRTYHLHDVTVRMRRLTADGRELATAEATLFEEALRAGWWPDTEPTASDAERALASLLTFSMQNLANSEPTLQDVLFLVVDAPSLWSIATHLGVNVLVTTLGGRPEPFPGALAGSSGATVHVQGIDLAINGTPALAADLLVVKPRGATMVCGGLVAAVARNPNEAGRSVAAKLLATRRGAVAQ